MTTAKHTTFHSLTYRKTKGEFGSWVLREGRDGTVLKEFYISDDFERIKEPTKAALNIVSTARGLLGGQLRELRIYINQANRKQLIKAIPFRSGGQNANSL